ncbi:MAG: DNA cytosine methyltransferase [Reyranella sp.]|uniref:DNA cytosine methyltransferase n=1 Tax=Reyranella sp. TaxID=1929291 RepID=UPI001AD00BA0|nr:DNA cytosine methyltransferase [Reyranella sp.]MBN9091538.1 DNA cytosine methyltransferase [Reyranella sp.]
MSKLTAISLFTGAGGLDFGFEAAGFRTAAALEIDERCCATLRHNRDWPVIQRDIAAVPTHELLEIAGLGIGEADVLIGGPPCQPFSKSGFWATGDAKRLDDPRANTLEGYLRVLAEARPKTFLLENVEGLGFRGKDEGLQLVHSRLAAINAANGTQYRATIVTLNAADYGVPQLRKRIFVIGARDGTPFNVPVATHASDAEVDWAEPRPRHVTAWDALHDLAEPNDPEVAVTGKWAELLPTIPEGRNYLWHTDRGGGEPLFGWRRRYWSFLLKIAKAQPAWTIQAQPGPATGPFHWNNRRLTIREMARLQTFPDDIEILGSIADAQRQLGNAVPSLLGEVLARTIAWQLVGVRDWPPPIKLAIAPAEIAPPPPLAPSPVPTKFLSLRGRHEAHPGTGKGHRAAARALAVNE